MEQQDVKDGENNIEKEKSQAVESDLEQQIMNSKKRKAERKEKKAQKKAKYMENISTKNEKKGQAVTDQQPDPNSSTTCQFYLKKKARFCNQHPKPGIFMLFLKLFELFMKIVN